MNERMKELDGVRGIALLLVFGLHVLVRAGYFTASPILLEIVKWRNFGVYGVDVFFALSGFLITSILLNTRGHKHYFRNFYARRILRIFPAYYLLLTFVLLFAPKVEANFMEQLPTVLPFFLLFQQNWVNILPSLPNTEYLSVTWSLAVEEQFYLLWPFAVYFLKKDTLLKASVGYIIVSILLRSWILQTAEDPAFWRVFFYHAPFRGFEEILMGGVLAILLTRKETLNLVRRYAGIAAVAAFALFAWAKIPFLSINYALVSLMTTAVIGFLATRPETLLHKIFSNNLLAFFGKYSYALYLFHLPVLVILLNVLWKTGWRGWWMFALYCALALALTVIAALLSWNLLEKHALNLKKYFEYH